MLFFLFKDFIYLFLGRGEWREKEGEGNTDQFPLLGALMGDQTLNPGLCPDQETTGVTLRFAG